MLRVTKLCDYAIVVLTHLAKAEAGTPETARDIAGRSEIPLPTVSKVLKQLSREGLVSSVRGARGGYHLTRAPEAITVADIITAVEGPIAITECSTEQASSCDVEDHCRVKANWRLITSVVADALARITLADMTAPLSPQLVKLRGAKELPWPTPPSI